MKAKFKEKGERKTFEIYVGNSLYSISNGLGGGYKTPYSEVIEPQNKDTRTGDEIALDVIKKAGLKVVS